MSVSDTLSSPAAAPLPAAARRRGLRLLPALAFAGFLFAAYGWRQAALGIAAVAMGQVFYRCQFGFASTWRALILRGDGRGLRAQMLWVALAAIPFALLTGTGDVFSAQAAANVRPLTVAVAAGAFIFGIGMQLGGACTSGSIVGAAGGGAAPMLAIIGFIAGALLAAAQIEFWNALPGAPAFSFYQAWGMGGALLMMLCAAALAAATWLLPKSDAPAPGRMPLWQGAVIIAFLSVLILFFGEQPWGFINGLTIAGGKALLAAGYEDIVFWDFWARYPSGEQALHDGWFAGSQITAAIGMLLGALLAAGAAGKIAAPWRNVTAKRLLLGAAGGLIMGYGAQISYGCNIGSYISALSSGSAHGWMWLLFAFAGTAAGVALRRLVGLDK